MCAIVGVFKNGKAVDLVLKVLRLMYKRGEDGCGVTVRNSQGEWFHQVSQLSIVDAVNQDIFSELSGDAAIGHDRYATTGCSGVRNNQPIFYQTPFRLSLVHNGNIPDHEELAVKLGVSNIPRFGLTDTEVLAVAIASSRKSTFREKLIDVFSRIPLAYSVIVMTDEAMYAIRDRSGNRPLHLAEVDTGYMVSSENFVFRHLKQVGARIGECRDIEPGEMVVVKRDKHGYDSVMIAPLIKEEDRLSKVFYCSLAANYFDNPASTENDCPHWLFRMATGFKLGKEIESKLEEKGIKIDFVASVPDSGNWAAKGFSEALGIRQIDLFQRSHNPNKGSQSRTYTDPGFDERGSKIRWKLLPLGWELPERLKKNPLVPQLSFKIKGKVVAVVDDSIIHSSTMTEVVDMLREAQAAGVVIVSVFPPVNKTCLYGMNHTDVSKLVANNRTVDEISSHIERNSFPRNRIIKAVFYISQETYGETFRELYGFGFCGACFGGNDPKDVYLSDPA